MLGQGLDTRCQGTELGRWRWRNPGTAESRKRIICIGDISRNFKICQKHCRICRICRRESSVVQCLIAPGNCRAPPDFPGFANECSGAARHGTVWHGMAKNTSPYFHMWLQFWHAHSRNSQRSFPSYGTFIASKIQSFQIVSLSQCILQGLPSRARGDLGSRD